jgi:hypothetical protein
VDSVRGCEEADGGCSFDRVDAVVDICLGWDSGFASRVFGMARWGVGDGGVAAMRAGRLTLRADYGRNRVTRFIDLELLRGMGEEELKQFFWDAFKEMERLLGLGELRR